jgi:hypothetical protein
MRTNNSRLLTAIAVSTVVVACGGGSGYGGGSNPQQTLKMAQAPSQPFSTPPTTLTGTDSSGNNWSGTYSSTPGDTGRVFRGRIASTSAIALTISKNGVVAATETSTEYYLTSPYSPLGIDSITNGVARTAVINSYTPLPATLTVGGSGPVLSATYYDAANNVIGSLTETYTVSSAGTTAVFLNINGAGTINGVQETEMLSYFVASNGTLLGFAQAQITVNGTTVTLQSSFDY